MSRLADCIWVDLVSQVMVGIWDRAELNNYVNFEFNKKTMFLPGFDGTEFDLEGVDKLEFEDEFLRRKIF